MNQPEGVKRHNRGIGRRPDRTPLPGVRLLRLPLRQDNN